MTTKFISRVLIGLEAFIALTAIGGGVGLIVTHGLGMSTSLLQHSPFVYSYEPSR